MQRETSNDPMAKHKSKIVKMEIAFRFLFPISIYFVEVHFGPFHRFIKFIVYFSPNRQYSIFEIYLKAFFKLSFTLHMHLVDDKMGNLLLRTTTIEGNGPTVKNHSLGRGKQSRGNGE